MNIRGYAKLMQEMFDCTIERCYYYVRGLNMNERIERAIDVMFLNGIITAQELYSIIYQLEGLRYER